MSSWKDLLALGSWSKGMTVGDFPIAIWKGFKSAFYSVKWKPKLYVLLEENRLEMLEIKKTPF